MIHMVSIVDGLQYLANSTACSKFNSSPNLYSYDKWEYLKFNNKFFVSAISFFHF